VTLARPMAATKVRRTSLSVAEFDSTDKDVRRTEEIAHEETNANGGHGSNTIDTPISVPNCPQITQIHADERLDVAICVNLRDLRASFLISGSAFRISTNARTVRKLWRLVVHSASRELKFQNTPPRPELVFYSSLTSAQHGDRRFCTGLHFLCRSERDSDALGVLATSAPAKPESRVRKLVFMGSF